MEEFYENGNYQTETNDNVTNPTNLTKQESLESLLDHMEISVVEAEKRANKSLNLKEFYTVYLVETKVIDPNFKHALTNTSSLWRRYTEFELLRAYLEVTYPYIVLPALPEKKVLYAWQKVTTDTFDPDFVDRRRTGLETFLLRVASHPILIRDKYFMGFLQQPDNWRETLKETGYLQQTESKLKALSVSVRLKKPDKDFERLKNYGIELQNNLSNLLRVRSHLAEKQYILYKLHANYGRVFSEWSAIETEMGDGLQKSGHYMDSLAATIDTSLEEEELVADQFKEWLFAASALQAVVRRREALQLAREEAQDLFSTTTEQKDKVLQGKSGFVSRLFGSVDTEEVREMKIVQLDQRMVQNDLILKQTTEELESFSVKAIKDIDRFQQQKLVDLKQTLATYCVLQFKLARKGLQSWEHIKQCLEGIP